MAILNLKNPLLLYLIIELALSETRTPLQFSYALNGGQECLISGIERVRAREGPGRATQRYANTMQVAIGYASDFFPFICRPPPPKIFNKDPFSFHLDLCKQESLANLKKSWAIKLYRRIKKHLNSCKQKIPGVREAPFYDDKIVGRILFCCAKFNFSK